MQDRAGVENSSGRSDSRKREMVVGLHQPRHGRRCWCCVGSDRVAGVGVSLGTLDLVRVDGRPYLGWCSHTTISRLRLSDRPLEFLTPARSCTVRLRAAVRRRVLGLFSGARSAGTGFQTRARQRAKGWMPDGCARCARVGEGGHIGCMTGRVCGKERHSGATVQMR